MNNSPPPGTRTLRTSRRVGSCENNCHRHHRTNINPMLREDCLPGTAGRESASSLHQPGASERTELLIDRAASCKPLSPPEEIRD